MLKSVANLTPKLWHEGMGKGAALFGVGEVVVSDKECGDGDEISVIFSKVGE